MNIYYLQYCFRRPTVLLTILAIISMMIVLHQYYQKDSNGNNSIYYHPNRLTREDSSIYEYRKYQNSIKADESNHNERIDRNELLLRIEDLEKIKSSIRNELRLMEKEKAKLLKEKASLVSKNDKLLTQISKSKMHLKQLDLDISANRRQKFEHNCDLESIPPIIYNPMKSIDIEQLSLKIATNNHHELDQRLIPNNNNNSTMAFKRFNGFDYSYCSLAKEFKFYLNYNDDDDDETTNRIMNTDFSNETTINMTNDFKIAINILKYHRQYTTNVIDACIVITVLDSTAKLKDIRLPTDRNNLIINLDRFLHKNNNNIPENVAIASASFETNSFRDHFDIVIPSIWPPPISYSTVIGSMPPHSPVDKKYLAAYFGREVTDNEEKINLNIMEQHLQIIHKSSIDDMFLFIYNCGPNLNLHCYDEKDKMIETSTFLIILVSTTKEDVDEQSNNMLHMALSKGVIPVIIGHERTKLPYSDVIDWRKASILLNTARLPELHFILKSISTSDLYQLKYFGRRIFEEYLATFKQTLDTIINIVSLDRFGYPPLPVEDIKTISYFSDSVPNNKLKFDLNCTSQECIEAKTDSLNSLLSAEILGPRERPFSSPTYRRNISLVLNFAYDLWNNQFYSPKQLYPSYPIDPKPPSEYKFYSLENNYRPIGDGLGGSGIEFSRSIGGDYPNEQFTIVLLTYERNTLLMKTLERLKGLPYLNKILIVWNGISHKPPDNILWPDVGVPIVVVKVSRNSLNNRFLPYDAIETDAILSLDDDSPLRQDEIVFAFRVWRESRDRIVGFPGRYHAWDNNQNSWLYNSNHSCELSMVLTGGAFFHKYYTYIYTYKMPKVIHSIVDKFMNCEDIAMNFLVSHLTRKPPIKVTSRWTFHCASCTSSLSEDDSHFRERHECLNTFFSIYGYMPLLNTQHRSDSVLFKTRLPHDKQKCFKFV